MSDHKNTEAREGLPLTLKILLFVIGAGLALVLLRAADIL